LNLQFNFGQLQNIMTGRHQWYIKGQLLNRAETVALSVENEWELMSRQGAVRLTSGHLGTEVKWVIGSPHLASLFAAEAMIEDEDGPCVLRFYAAGWFEERYSNCLEACQRMRVLAMHGDRFFTSRVFEKPSVPNETRTPDIVRQVLRDRRPPPDYSVECRFDPDQDSFVVMHIGHSSTIGRIWGTDPNSFPCLATGAFGNSASCAYKRALDAGNPVYEQVVASLRFPDEAFRWVAYHRVIVPMASKARPSAVTVVSEYADVDFKVL
jgi:hypothetical protein